MEFTDDTHRSIHCSQDDLYLYQTTKSETSPN